MASLAEAETLLNLPCLFDRVILMLVGTLYPPLLADATRRVSHLSVGLAFCAMSAGVVRRVGFVPCSSWLRWLFSACEQVQRT
ncbi:hypothetical protein BRAS3843_120028 [Bradyrhizobium sp. STM 3843]|uniref:cyd operon YbgE family protein n=1 Tax=Bradyrhizobium sp. STM 3843 TaxID=551947 RepID=UPI00024066BA|nr:cyd operon YbgE family protein [Bradyrhizobium sp. STM 3843]CCE04856.1 hypothetical protein BRAS3843_120028 [Bradyrhizobium sp. STM 3843]